MASRFCGPGMPYKGLIEGGRWNGRVRLVEEHLADPLRRRKPRRIFVNSMSDLFHPNVTEEVLNRIFAVMAVCGIERQKCARKNCDHDSEECFLAMAEERHPMPIHTFQVLTKRPERLHQYLSDPYREGIIRDAVRHAGGWSWSDGIEEGMRWPLPNVWLGVTAENQVEADRRIPLLLQTPAALRFVSVEPMLGPVDLSQIRHGADLDLPVFPEWVICGGESGPGARPMHPDWARSLRDQCVAAGMPFFFKQWGEWAPNCLCDRTDPCREIKRPEPGLPGVMFRCGKESTGRLLDGRAWLEMPEARP